MLTKTMKKDVFKYPDTNSSRAEIEYLNRKFAGQKIGIIGLGGTGSYILDLVSKTPVEEIHIYDGDIFELHSAFRAPGATPVEKFDSVETLMKVDYYHEIYSRMHSGIFAHPEYITMDNIGNFSGFNFVFMSIDDNEARCRIVNGLIRLEVPFIDVGLGVNKVADSLISSVRVTHGSTSKNDHLSKRFGEAQSQDNEYAPNIQIADLNCLNATLAVIKWKKILGFYQDLKQEHNNLYFTTTGKMLNEDFTA